LKDELSKTDLSKTYNDVAKLETQISKENPYEVVGSNIPKKQFNNTQKYSDSSREKRNKSVNIEDIKRVNNLLPAVNSRLGFKEDLIYNNFQANGARIQPTQIIADKNKYNRRSISHKRSHNMANNLTQLLSENMKKELELERNAKIQAKLSQTRHRNELWAQVKYNQETKRQMNRSNRLMDEEYINMGKTQVLNFNRQKEANLRKVKDLSNQNQLNSKMKKQKNTNIYKLEKQNDFISVQKHQQNFKKEVLQYNMIKQGQQDSLKNHIVNTIKYKENKVKETKDLDKQWEEKYIQNLYNEKPDSMLDFFFLNKDKRGYECPIMRQKKSDVNSGIYHTYDTRQANSSFYSNQGAKSFYM